ncbi:hypothetical protein ILUMI_03106 [Ignelater luminosus]|uniref:FXNA-like protease n=1 Tax=Ignelater luminosus TaxID=2038154 RepID=A0A8K0GFU7_IGNLU|nr:hypothetical protein ILUMI_03106 [Ignelater luminosus]
MRKRRESNGVEKEYFIIEDAEKYSKKENIHKVHPIVALILLVYLFGLYGIAYLIEESLPTPLQISDEKNQPDAFIAERARNDLKELLNIGPRTTGSYENEVLAVDFLKRKIADIQRQAHSNQRMQMDVQVSSGSYYLDFRPYGAISAYGKIQNVLVKLHSKKNSKHSLLVNTHFDTVIGSPGGSGAGIMCTIALEILRKLSRLPEPPEHNIIFLFNGAEETPLQGSHAFVQDHIWAKEVEVLVNLDAGGAGGKEFPNLIGPKQPWMLKYCRKMPHPYAQVFGEELFESGVMPSDTDFTVFKGIGGMIGLEYLFYKDAFRYHTPYDGFSNIQLGTYQHAGDNMLFLIRNLANAPELSHVQDQPKDDLIFYDFLEFILVSYTKTTAVALSIGISIASTAITFRSFRDFNLRFSFSSIKYLIVTFGALLLGWNLSAIPVFAVATILDILGFSMRWFNNIWLLVGLYGTPIICCCCGVIVALNKFYKKSNLSINTQAQIQIHLVRIIWIIVLLIGTFSGIRSIYPVLMLLFFQTLTDVIIRIFSLQHSSWKIVYILGTTIPTLVFMKQTQQILAGVIPLCGRWGSHRNSEVFIASLTLFITILITSSYIPLITLIRKPRIVLRTLIGIFVIFFVITFTSLTFPYTNNPESPRPQRFPIFHTSRVFRNNTNEIYKNDSAYVIFNLDRNAPGSVRNYVKSLSRAQPILDDCENSLLCGISVMDPRLLRLLPYSTLIPAEPPIIQDPITLKLNSRTRVTDSVTRFDFTASGPSQSTFYVSARPGTKLLETNLVPTLPPNPVLWNNRLLYVIVYSWGKERTPLNLTLDFETPLNWTKPVFDIAMMGNNKDKKTIKTSQFVEFLNELPEWVSTQIWLSQYESWVY